MPTCSSRRGAWPRVKKAWFSFRKTGGSALRRELIIAFGATGYLAQFEIEPALKRVIVLAVRHQREDDYH